jgi:hypothetical protein
MSVAIPAALRAAAFVPIPCGDKVPAGKWRDVRLSNIEAQAHLDRGGNLALRVGQDSGGIVDVDLDCPDAIKLADLYLPPTEAIFGRPSKPRSHRLFIAPGATFAAFADPTDGSMLIELRADGREGGAHLTLLPPSVTDGECREWQGDTVEPATIEAAILGRRVVWLAIGSLVARHVSRYAAERPGPDLPDLLWEVDREILGRPVYRWLGKPAPDEARRHPKPRHALRHEELRLAEIVARIPNHFGWDGWNRIGMAIYAASGGSEEGFTAFDDLSARSPKYDQYATQERWRNYRRSPPSHIGIGTLVHLAKRAGWRRSAA